MSNFLKIAAAAVCAAMVCTSCGNAVSAVNGANESFAENTSAEVIDATAAPSPASASDRSSALRSATEEPIEPFSLNEEMPAGYDMPRSYVIDGFNAVLQEPELPTGCEVTSLTADLNFLGFNVDKITLCDDFLPIALAGECVMDEAYVGNPRYDGFGCNANVIVQTADKYFASVDSPCYGVDLTGQELNEVLYQVTQGRPVLAWSTIDLRVSYPEYVWTASNGKELVFDWYQHCMVVYGFDYDQGIIYAADPLKGNTTYSIEAFENIYGIMGKQAVVICGDSTTQGHHGTTEAEKSITRKSLHEQEAETAPNTEQDAEMENS